MKRMKQMKRIIGWMLILCMLFTTTWYPLTATAAAETEPEVPTYTVTLPSGDGYVAIPYTAEEANMDNLTTVKEGSDFQFQLLVNGKEGYSASTSVTANGTKLVNVEGIYTIEKITEDQKVVVEGVKKEQFAVTFPKNPTGYRIEVLDDSTMVDYNGSINFSVKLDEDYNQSVPVVKMQSADILSPDENGIYGVAAIKNNISITVEGVKLNTSTNALSRSTSTDEVKTYLSDIEWKTATNAVGAEGENNVPTKDGKHYSPGKGETKVPIQLLVNGTPTNFDKGIGIQTDSVITYDLAKKGYTSFHAMIGVDYRAFPFIADEICDIQFTVSVDGKQVFDSGVMDPSHQAKEINIPLTEDNKILELKAVQLTQAWSDWGDWADAHFLGKPVNPDVVPATGMELSLSAGSVKVGKTAKITAAFTPADATDTDVTYTSENPEIATVNSTTGVVTGISEGSAKIIGQTAEGIIGELTVLVGSIAPRYEISSEHPMYLENYYWSDDALDKDGIDPNVNFYGEDRIDSPVMLWNTIPESLKENTVILLIAERSLTNSDKVREWITENVALCNENQIPCAVQVVNGETKPSAGKQTIPVSYWGELAKNNEYLVGFNAAELYNGGGSRQYVMDVIEMGISYGVSMMWTDTNIDGIAGQGLIYGWLNQDNQMSTLMRENKEYISLMTKESWGHGTPNSDALYKGLWLTDYIGSWGTASDWWHWQLESNGELFVGGGDWNDGWRQCLTWPENLFTQDVLMAASQGATCFKSEAQWYSNATKGMRTPTYQYSMIPFLEKLVSQEIKIPTKEEVLERTKAIVVGRANWNEFNYDTNYSNLYPSTGQYGIVPYVPLNCPQSSLDLFELQVKTNLGTNGLKAALDQVYPTAKSTGNAYCENFGDTWYFINNSENKNETRSTTFTPNIFDSTSVNITAEPHAFAVIKEMPKALNVYLSNYRIDKSDLWKKKPITSADYITDQGAYNYVWNMCERMFNGTSLDTQLRDTVITVTSPVEPTYRLISQSPADRSYSEDTYVRPFEFKTALKAGTTDEWTVTISHNGIVELDIITGDADLAIALDKTEASLKLNEELQLHATTLPDGEPATDIIWTSSKPSIATVERGKVTPVSAGTTTITAMAVNGASATCTITVIPTVTPPVIAPTDIILDKTSATLTEAQTLQLAATVSPSDTTDKTVTWSSDKTNVATVTGGNVTAVAAGTATITATTVNGLKATCTITVTPPVIAPAGIALDKTSATLTEAQTLQLAATVSPSNATDKTITWSSDNTNVATVTGGSVTAVAAGTATITATTINGLKASCIITVNAKQPVLPASVQLDRTSATLSIEEQVTLIATVAPAAAADKSLTWSTSNSNVAIVTNGVVKGVGVGQATITAKTTNGITASCTITVTGLSMAEARINTITDQKHTGKEVKPSIQVTYGNTPLKNNTDYSISYKNNIKPGKATITVTGKGKYYGTLTKSFNIKAAKGKTYTVGKYKYLITNDSTKNGTVSFVGATKNSYQNITVANSIKLGSYTYKVTKIADKAFKNNKKLTSVVIGSNVSTIGTDAFYNTPKLKKITIKSKVLKSISKKAFRKTNSRLVIKVPSSKLANYKKLLANKGLSGKAAIKK